MLHTAFGMRDRRRGWRVDRNRPPWGRESVTRRSTARRVCASLGWLPAMDTSWGARNMFQAYTCSRDTGTLLIMERPENYPLYVRCAIELSQNGAGCEVPPGLLSLATHKNTSDLSKTWGRSSVGRAPALQVDKPKRCALVRFRRWVLSAEARIIRSSPKTQDRLRGPIGCPRG